MLLQFTRVGTHCSGNEQFMLQNVNKRISLLQVMYTFSGITSVVLVLIGFNTCSPAYTCSSSSYCMSRCVWLTYALVVQSA